MLKRLFLISVPLLAACGGRVSGQPADPTGADGVALSVGSDLSSCPSLSANVTETTPGGQVVIQRACFEDEAGHFYDAAFSDGPSPFPPDQLGPILPAGHDYSFVVQFGDSFVPTAGAVASAGAGAAYVAAEGTYGSSGCVTTPEEVASNLVVTKTTLQGATLTVSLVNPVANGGQVDVEVGSLLLASVGGEGGFNARFYVGSVATGAACSAPASTVPNGP